MGVPIPIRSQPGYMIGIMTRHCQRNPMYTSPRYHSIPITISSHWPFCNPSFYFQETGVSATYPSASTASSLPKTQWQYPLNPLSHTPLHPPLHPLLRPTPSQPHHHHRPLQCLNLRMLATSHSTLHLLRRNQLPRSPPRQAATSAS